MANRVTSPVFAGREAELTLLARAFEAAADGTPGTVLVGAEAGGGKSRLVAADVMVSDTDGYVFRHELIREAVFGD